MSSVPLILPRQKLLLCAPGLSGTQEKSYTTLIPWDHANYGLDEHWVRCFPYEQDVIAAEGEFTGDVHESFKKSPQIASCRPILPNHSGATGPRTAGNDSRQTSWKRRFLNFDPARTRGSTEPYRHSNRSHLCWPTAGSIFGEAIFVCQG